MSPAIQTHRAPRSEQKKQPIAANLAAFQEALTGWFAQAGRDLPWRRTGDPYAILVSEMMLQQTQVATVVGYFHRWMERFPTVETLARAGEAEVLQLWQGLGYYSRAKRLAAAAREIVERHGGVFPRDEEAIRALPGVGPYTAAAVATFAFDRPVPPIDGNIARVMARLLDDPTPVDTAAGSARLRETAIAWQPRERAGVFNEALMELGALICTPRTPSCLICPVQRFCATETPERLPVKKPRPKVVALDELCGWIEREGAILLEQQTGSRWNGLWRLPLLKGTECGGGGGEKPLVRLTYPFTNHRITLRVIPAPAPRSLPENWAWISHEQLAKIAMTAPHRRAVEALLRRSEN